MNKCPSCNEEIPEDARVCKDCFRDPDTNNCKRCDKHLLNIPYAYTCGACIEREISMRLIANKISTTEE